MNCDLYEKKGLDFILPSAISMLLHIAFNPDIEPVVSMLVFLDKKIDLL